MFSFKSKKLVFLWVTVLGLSVLGIGFNNCGGTIHTPQKTSDMSGSYDSVVTALKQVHTGQMSSQFCADQKNYSCLHKVFSTAASDDSNEDLGVLCSQDLCASVKRYTYNTRPAEEACLQDKCDLALERNFNYEEFECHLKLSTKADGAYPLIAIDGQLEVALLKVHESCLKIQEGN